MMYNTEVVREAVIGYVVLKSADCEIVYSEPLVKYVDSTDDDFYVKTEGAEVVCAIPATPGTFRVSGWCNDTFFENIGYEFVGVEPDNWRKILTEKYDAYLKRKDNE